jgi:hypothetical protein
MPDCRKFQPRVRAISPTSHTISSAELPCSDGHHQAVRLWNRGAFCGELLVEVGDGERILDLLGMTEIDPGAL